MMNNRLNSALNNKSKKKMYIFGSLLLASIAITVINLIVISQKNPKIAPTQATLRTNYILESVNEYRIKENIAELTIDPRLEKSAIAKCNDMVKDHYFSHEDENGDVWGFIKAEMPDLKHAGENLAISDQDEGAIVDDWYNSTTHKKNMLDSNFTTTGIAICKDPSFVYEERSNLTFVVQHFAN